jgi:lipopolysaccharide export system permease protein
VKGFTKADRYVAVAVLKGYGLVTTVLLVLFSLFAFREELESVGAGAYNALGALLFVAMTTPARILRLLPFVTLLGTAYGLWQLARRSELLVLRAAGASLPRMALATLLPGMLILLATPVMHEYLSPRLYAGATLARDLALGRADEVAGRGFWSRSERTLIEVGGLEHGRVPTNLRIYELGEDATVRSVILAASADPLPQGTWRLVEAERRVFTQDGMVRTAAPAEWRPWWVDESFLRAPPVDSLSFSDLAGYVRYLQETGQPSARWELAYWRMWALPLTAVLLGLLALPMAQATARQGTARYAGLALGTGLAYYFLEQLLSNVGLVAQLPALGVAFLPPLVLLGLVGVVLRPST